MFYIVFHGVFLTKTSVFSEKSVNFNFLVAALDVDVVNDDHDDMERPIPPSAPWARIACQQTSGRN